MDLVFFIQEYKSAISQLTTPDISTLKSRAWGCPGGRTCSDGIMAMRAQRRTIIDPMYFEDADVMNVLRIIMSDPCCLPVLKPQQLRSYNLLRKKKLNLKSQN